MISLLWLCLRSIGVIIFLILAYNAIRVPILWLYHKWFWKPLDDYPDDFVQDWVDAMNKRKGN